MPRFNRTEAERVFFEDLFDHLVGTRPKKEKKETETIATTPPSTSARAERGDEGSANSTDWSTIISSITLEDEVKSLKRDLDNVVTTPSQFASRGHQAARRDFTLLTLLFAIIVQHEGNIRWKENAREARDLFGRTAANLQAGGSIQVYNESKLRKQDLQDLIRGAKLTTETRAQDGTWEERLDRTALMQVLEMRLEANLKQWVNNAGDFRTRADRIRHESELVAAIGAVLSNTGMDDAEEEEYRQFAHALQRGGTELAEAIGAQDQNAADRALVSISRSCTDCHATYR